MDRLPPEKIKRIVVRGTSWVGDAAMTVPALRGLRRLFPEAHITLVTRQWAEGLFEDASFLNDLLIYDRHGFGSVLNQIREWCRHRFDLAVLLPNSFEAALIAALARVPFRLGYNTDARGMLLTNPIKIPEWRSTRHEVFYYLNLITELQQLVGKEQVLIEGEADFSLNISDRRKNEALELLRHHGVRQSAPLIALCPGSINSRAKRWPIESYAALADRFNDEVGAEILLIGSPEELDISRAVANLMAKKATVLTGETNLASLVAVLSHVDLLVTNDTGSAHIASALGRSTVVIFGPTNPLTTRPFSLKAELVREPPDCAPCMLRDCPIDHRCMTAISPGRVFEQASVLLERDGFKWEAKGSNESNSFSNWGVSISV